jgi:hypothetical protein
MPENARSKQLRERDVRKLSPELDAGTFMQLYMESNFPQTSSMPSKGQLEFGVDSNQAKNDLKLMKKPLSGTQYDNPGGF